MSATAAKAKSKKPKAGGKPPRPTREAPALPAGTEVLLGRAQVIAALGVCDTTFKGMLARGEYPKPDRYIGDRPMWRQATHNAWTAGGSAAGGTGG